MGEFPQEYEPTIFEVSAPARPCLSRKGSASETEAKRGRTEPSSRGRSTLAERDDRVRTAADRFPSPVLPPDPHSRPVPHSNPPTPTQRHCHSRPPAPVQNYVAEIRLDGKAVQLALWDTA